MSDKRHLRIKSLFLEALALSEAERSAFLARLAQRAADEHAEVVALLAHADEGEVSGSPIDGPRLRPGDRFAERYQIERALGRGGSGEIYLAQDLVLQAPVALKLLRSRARGGPEAILNEVRLARQITHPAVCRVFDVGQHAGELFITLEFVDGEDLATRVKRTGGLPPDEVLAIARQLCAGLAAAHARGILHRDLKPANVLIDRAGQVRITDFGLAVSRSNAQGGSGGTPSYMAPEQSIPGADVTEQTDLYALGLLLHELLTGEPVFPGPAAFGASRPGRRGLPIPPSSLIAGVDPALDAVIRAATDPDPRRRPASALEIAARLPGGDPLGIALATGSLAAPEIVASADVGSKPLSRSARAGLWVLLSGSFALLLALGSNDWRRAATQLVDSPTALDEKLQRAIRTFGIDPQGAPVDRGFIDEPAHDPLPGRVLYWQRVKLAAAQVDFWERLRDAASDNIGRSPAATTDLVVACDLQGRLIYFRLEDPTTAVVPRTGRGMSSSIDWAPVFAAAGLDPANLQALDTPLPDLFATIRLAWGYTPSDRAETASMVQAALIGDQVVSFQVQRSRTEPSDGRQQRVATVRLRQEIMLGFALGVPLLALVLSIRHLRQGRADRRGARRLAWTVLIPALVTWFLLEGHAPSPARSEAGNARLLLALLAPIPVWLCYIGFEPWARRLQPRLMVAWSRLLSGRIRDPLVGRSLVIGLIVGVWFVVIDQIDRRFCTALGRVTELPTVTAEHLDQAIDLKRLVAATVFRLPDALTLVIPFVLLLVIIRRLLPQRWSLPTTFVLYTALFWALLANSPGASLFVGAPLTAFVTLVTLQRFGLLALVVAATTGYALANTPLTLSLGAWYAASTVLALGLVLGLGLLGVWLAGPARIQAAP